MRVVGGRCKGRKLASFRGGSIRPTSDKVREAVYDILPKEPFEKVLDLFAGTGAMGIEALSRGSGEAVFVDRDPAAAGLIRKNLEACGLNAKVLRMDAATALRAMARAGERFDLIIIDPPYDSSLTEQALETIFEQGLLCSGGFVVVETSKRNPVEAAPPGAQMLDERRYGDTLVYFFTRDGE